MKYEKPVLFMSLHSAFAVCSDNGTSALAAQWGSCKTGGQWDSGTSQCKSYGLAARYWNGNACNTGYEANQTSGGYSACYNGKSASNGAGCGNGDQPNTNSGVCWSTGQTPDLSY